MKVSSTEVAVFKKEYEEGKYAGMRLGQAFIYKHPQCDLTELFYEKQQEEAIRLIYANFV